MIILYGKDAIPRKMYWEIGRKEGKVKCNMVDQLARASQSTHVLLQSRTRSPEVYYGITEFLDGPRFPSHLFRVTPRGITSVALLCFVAQPSHLPPKKPELLCRQFGQGESRVFSLVSWHCVWGLQVLWWCGNRKQLVIFKH